VAIATGAIEQSHGLDEQYFGEGLPVDEQLIQLTLAGEHGVRVPGLVLDQTGTFSYATEGWGSATTAGGW
jgi:glutamine cyclotransferase